MTENFSQSSFLFVIYIRHTKSYNAVVISVIKNAAKVFRQPDLQNPKTENVCDYLNFFRLK